MRSNVFRKGKLIMALSDKDREYISRIRKGLEKKEQRSMGFNTIAQFGRDAGFKVFDDMVESDEVANEDPVSDGGDADLPSADIFDDDDFTVSPSKRLDGGLQSNVGNVRMFDNTTSIAQDAGTSYDENLLGFDAADDMFDGSHDGDAPAAKPVSNGRRTDGDDRIADIGSRDVIGSGIREDDLVKAGDLLDALKQVVANYGRLPVAVISIDDSDIPITSIDIDDSHRVIRITGTLDED